MSRRPARCTEADLREAVQRAKAMEPRGMVVVTPDGIITVAPMPARPDPRAITYLYFVQALESRRIKIGFTTKLGNRLLAIATYCPEPVRVVGVMHGTMQEELALHEKFKSCRVRGEWFAETPELLDYIKSFAQDIKP